MPIDAHILKGDIHGFAKAVIPAAIQCGLLDHHEMQMVPGADASIVRFADELPLAYISPFGFQGCRDAILGEVQIDLIGPGRSGAVFKGNTIGAA